MRLPIILVPASSSEKITVSAQPEIVDTSQTSRRVFRGRRKNRRAASPEPQFAGLRSSRTWSFDCPACASDGRSHAAGHGSGFTFGGLRASSNTISIDGLDNNDEYSGSNRTGAITGNRAGISCRWSTMVSPAEIWRSLWGLDQRNHALGHKCNSTETRFCLLRTQRSMHAIRLRGEPGKAILSPLSSRFRVRRTGRQGSNVLLRGGRAGAQPRPERFGH